MENKTNKSQSSKKSNNYKSRDNDFYSHKRFCVKQSRRYMERLSDDNYCYMGGGCFHKRMHNLND